MIFCNKFANMITNDGSMLSASFSARPAVLNVTIKIASIETSKSSRSILCNDLDDTKSIVPIFKIWRRIFGSSIHEFAVKSLNGM